MVPEAAGISVCRKDSVFLSTLYTSDGAAHLVYFVQCGHCGYKRHCLEGKMDKKVFAMASKAEFVVFHNSEC